MPGYPFTSWNRNMRAVIQRVEDCSVTVDGEVTGAISRGLLMYLGVEKNDTERDLEYILDKTIHLRIYEDENGKMNLSLPETGGQILVVSQFTLCADTRKGRRPSYNNAADPQKAERLYRTCLDRLSELGFPPRAGIFAAKMRVTSTNAGPVTILLDSNKTF